MFSRLVNAYLVATAPIPDLKHHAWRLRKCIGFALRHLANGEEGARKLERLVLLRRISEAAKHVQDRYAAEVSARIREMRDTKIEPVAPAPAREGSN